MYNVLHATRCNFCAIKWINACFFKNSNVMENIHGCNIIASWIFAVTLKSLLHKNSQHKLISSARFSLIFLQYFTNISRYVKPAFHDTDTATDSDSPDTPTFLRPTRAISWSYSCGKLNDTPTFSQRSSRGCRLGCRCRRRGMWALLIVLAD